MISFTIRVLGCKVSQCDANNIKNQLISLGLIEDAIAPDLIIIHGCSVTARASQKAAQLIRSLTKQFASAKIVLSGCEARLQKNLSKPLCDGLLFTTDPQELKNMLCNLFPAEQFETALYFAHTEHFCSKTRAFLKVQDGCNQFCTYCIIPHLRGRETSIPIEKCLQKAQELAQNNHKEIVLTGIHLGHYKPSLRELLEHLDQVEGIERIRLGSIESIEIGDSLIDWLVSSPKACKHLHLPLQSGSDNILKKMNRPYTSSDFRNLAAKLKTDVPRISLTTDLIVGFPSESDKDFSDSLKIIDEVCFSKVHIFRFSPRDGTPAATMSGQIPNESKILRAQQAEKLSKQRAQEYFKCFVNSKVEVLWETFKNGSISGLNREYLNCTANFANADLINSINKLVVIGSNEYGLELKL